MKIGEKVQAGLRFFDLMDDPPGKLSLTKVQAWGAAILNFINLAYQFAQAHPDPFLLIGTGVTHALSALKHELKRRSDNA